MGAIELERALIAPPQNVDGQILTTAVYDQTGQVCDFATTWRRDKPITRPPKTRPQKKTTVKGRWLWGGVLFHHFGHFQVESLSRLWKLPAERERLDGVLFVERQNRGRLLAFERDFLDLMGCDLPVRICHVPTEAERLYVPGQAFGLGKIAPATRVFRRFVRANFAQNIAPDGPEHLFISRSKQSLDAGGFLGEALLDKRMSDAGYEIFHPEHHKLTVQIARYKAAKRIVALDGSALHLVAMVAAKGQRVAMILRRPRIGSLSLRKQMGWFMERAPLVINAFQGETETVLGKKRLITDLDFERIGKSLKKGRFIPKDMPWGPLEDVELTQIETQA